MLFKSHVIIYSLLLVVAFKVNDAITVSPTLCPSNKIAPHRRIINTYNARTFGHLLGLVGDNNGGYGGGNLQERPQEDDPDDCGEIDDYDENDLSALTVNYGQRRDNPQNKFFFNWFGGDKPQTPPDSQYPGDLPQPNRPPPGHRPPQVNRPPVTRPPVRPPPPHPTYSPQRPPNGGYFANNPYRPPYQQHPSDGIKPVNEANDEPQVNYRPQVVGGQVGQVIGVPVRPVRPPPPPPVTYRPFTVVYPDRTQRPTYQTTRRSRPRNFNNNNSVFGSFIDLLF